MHDHPDPEQRAFLEEVATFLAAHGPFPVRSEAHRRRCLEALVDRGWRPPCWRAQPSTTRDEPDAPLTAQEAFLLDRALVTAGFPRLDPDTEDLVIPLLRACGTPAQIGRWLPGLASGEVAWVVHGVVRAALAGRLDTDALPVITGSGCRLAGTARVFAAANADRLLTLARDGRTNGIRVLAGALDAGAVTPGLPLDPDIVDLDAVPFERLGRVPDDTGLRAVFDRLSAQSACAPRCRTAEPRRMLTSLEPVVGGDEDLARQLRALAVDLAGLEALELRAMFTAAGAPPDPSLLAAVALRANALGTSLAGLAVSALGYNALPAPDPRRQHNELPHLLGGGRSPGADAVAALLRYVGGLDVMGVRDRLAGLTGSDPQQG